MLVGPFNASTWTGVSSSVSDAAVLLSVCVFSDTVLSDPVLFVPLLSVFVSVWPHPANRSTIARIAAAKPIFLFFFTFVSTLLFFLVYQLVQFFYIFCLAGNLVFCLRRIFVDCRLRLFD